MQPRIVPLLFFVLFVLTLRRFIGFALIAIQQQQQQQQ